jgi:hypothetical protein
MHRAYCDVDECLLEAERNGKCRGHHAQVERGRRARGQLREALSPWQAFHRAVLLLADCDAEDDAEYHRREALVRYHGRRYFCPLDCTRKACGGLRGG